MLKNNLYLVGRGDINLSSDGHYSDFFWAINSDFELSRIYYNFKNKPSAKNLLDLNIKLVDGFHVVANKSNLKDSRELLTRKNKSSEEREILGFLKRYNNEVELYQKFFYENNIKIYFTWHKFNSSHLAIGSAISNLEGVSIYWPTSFDGLPFYDSICNFDIIFSYSRFNALNDIASGSKFKYNIITGYIRDYAAPLLVEEAALIRKSLEFHGAKKIVFVVDENGLKDDRWHTGHGLQKDNYKFILDKLLSTPWLGVIFKPKNSKTLRNRLGAFSKLLSDAEATGRCLVLESTNGEYTPPPLLAGLSADLCIHAHLSAGTVALECALAGIPTLLIDREGCPFSKLHELPRNKVVFDDWPKAIGAMMDYFSDSDKDHEFGSWEPIIDELDPYRDGKAAYRIGSFLNSLLNEFDNGASKEEAMKLSVQKYTKEWGQDKVIEF